MKPQDLESIRRIVEFVKETHKQERKEEVVR